MRSRDGRDHLLAAVAKQPRRGLPLGGAQRVRLGLAPGLGHRLGEVGEDHGEPEPEGDLEGEADAGRAEVAAEELADEDDRRDGRADLDHEHHRIPPDLARVELPEGVDQRPGRRAGGSRRSVPGRRLAASSFISSVSGVRTERRRQPAGRVGVAGRHGVRRPAGAGVDCCDWLWLGGSCDLSRVSLMLTIDSYEAKSLPAPSR